MLKVGESGILIPVEPEPPKKPSFLEKHPTPWGLGECHECKTTIVDANGREVCVLKGGHDPIYGNHGDLGHLFVDLVNTFAQLTTSDHK